MFMKSLHKIVATLSLAFAILVAGSASADAKSEGTRQRPLTGTIISIDRASRTMLVRELITQQTYKVQVPAGRLVRTRHNSLASVNFEQLIPGMVITETSVE
jgi:hypothetical protein